jgi:adenosylhomocysteinase
MTIQTAVLIETLSPGRRRPLVLLQHLQHAGPRRRGRGGRAQGAAPSRIRPGIPVFAWKGETLEEYWWCTERALDFGGGKGPTRSSTTAATPRCSSTRAYEFEKAGKVPGARNHRQRRIQVILNSWPRRSSRPQALDQSRPPIQGVSEETTTGVHRLYEMQKGRHAPLPRHQRQRLRHQEQVRQPLRLPPLAGGRPDARHRRDAQRQSRRRLRLRRRRQGLRQSSSGQGAASSSPRSIPSAPCRPPWKVIRSDARRRRSPTPTSSSPPPATQNIITAEHMAKMKDKAIVGNIGHFDNEIDMAGLKKVKASRRPTSSRSTTCGPSPTATAC